MERICFYRVNEPFGAFSNFSPHPVRLKEKIWPTTEHYFQAQKFAGTDSEEEIRHAKSPMIAARMGRSRSRPLRTDWEAVKETIMREALHAKFTQHQDLRELLLSTGVRHLVEQTKNDSYWAVGAASIDSAFCSWNFAPLWLPYHPPPPRHEATIEVIAEFHAKEIEI